MEELREQISQLQQDIDSLVSEIDELRYAIQQSLDVLTYYDKRDDDLVQVIRDACRILEKHL
jgi:peptidoglycan hydrolase CwlO-like protein